MALIITFEIEPPRTEAVIAAIKALGWWGTLTPTCYLVESSANPGDLMNHLQPMLGPRDSLWVITAAMPWASYGDPVVEDTVEASVGESENWTPRDWDDETSSRR